MNFDDLQKTWQSPLNQPSPAQLEKDKMTFISELRKRHRGALIFFAWIFFVLTLFTGRLVVHLATPHPVGQAIDISREWGSFFLIALPWFALAFFFKQHLSHRARHPNYERSISASVRAALEENRLTQARQKWIMMLNGTVVLLMPLIVFQLRSVGKAGDEITLPAFVFLPALMLSISLGMWWHRRRTLRPRERELEALLATYREG